MNAVVIDSSSWISYFNGRGGLVIEQLLEHGLGYLPPVVAAELLSGRLTVTQRADLEDLLETLPVCPANLAHWMRVGRLRATLASNGLSVSTPDAHVAQCALDIGAELLSEDAVFSKIAQHVPLRLLE